MNIIKLQKSINAGLPGIQSHESMDPIRPKIRKWDHNGEAPKQSAVMILLYEDHGEWTFPLIQRPVYQGAHSGQISLPGGKFEEGDSDLIATAKRETYEEIGVSEKKINVLGELSEIYVPPSNFNIRPVVGMLCEKPDFQKDDREVEKIIEIAITDLLNPTFRKRKEIKVGANVRMNVPCFDFDEVLVWGATAMILSEFSEIIERTKV